ncbi:MAG: hypothetical protein ABS68_13670 [Niastella sp. SCN 39-18]|nr:hypothetical protein [Sphingobacteriales bacterium]ODT50407.1 MAG: hypothetical protein ABS68_13670 [Niastella sp. SCN 39-18]OJW09903.1 MAG: hypothetical protein BGO53_08740 [Sphingobacteriales bacterium 39-19]
MYSAPHQFHIPVMGLAFTIDSPVKVAQYGISSVISIMEDRLTEMMRKHYYAYINEPYIPITTRDENYREKRITDYLNLVSRIVSEKVDKIKSSVFEAGSEIVKYFEMLPDNSNIKQIYNQMTGAKDLAEKEALGKVLRNKITAGSIDVNIMTKLDKNNYTKDGVLIENGSDALAALRGYAKSDLTNSSVIFSAGINPNLYNYLEKLRAFDASGVGQFEKRIIIKVSDYRSALIQGKYLAKKGIWVSEFRVESGLNCGGHAFATDGYLMGPILEEFKIKRDELIATLFDIYNKALAAKSFPTFSQPHPIKISAQGGIGTYEECALLHQYYGIDSTGWGTPFLLVPEATTVDDATLALLQNAKKPDIYLSKNSPLGVPFHYLKGTSSDLEKLKRIETGKPGSPCTEKHLVNNTEFTEEPICTASLKYQKLKINHLQSLHLAPEKYEREVKNVLAKECLCIGLSNAASIKHEQPFLKNLPAVTICPGPNIAYFSKTVSLREMTDHIYGRNNIMRDGSRPHVFINELFIYISFLKEKLLDEAEIMDTKKEKYYLAFYNQLVAGIQYYREKAGEFCRFTNQDIHLFNEHLNKAELALDALRIGHATTAEWV